jgi:serine/threonine-protein kinase
MSAEPPDNVPTKGTAAVSPERFARVRAIFEAALDVPVRDRGVFVGGACVGDPTLRREVEAMLAADATGNALLDRPLSTPSSSAPEEGRFPAGTVLAGRYRILVRVGQGGMGEVYRAYDLILNQLVALKFLTPARLSEAALVRFRNEVRVARQVSHPNVCRVYDLGMVEGLHFLSMEYIDGEDLASLLRRIGRLPQDKAIEFTRKICAGLAAAHERGVLHRDLKPANIMIDGRGQPRITDFGLAGLAAEIPLSDLRSGTPAYMSPEQKAGKDVTVRSDIYSLGLVLHEMCTGKARKDTQSNPSDLVKDLDPAVERLILRCLEEDPKRRPSSAFNVAMALPGADPIAAALAAGETPSPEMVAASNEKEGFSHRTAVAYFAAALVFLVAGTFLTSKTSLLAKLPHDLPQDVLVSDAQRILGRLGYTDPPVSRYSGFEGSPLGLGTWHSDEDRRLWERAFARQQPAFVRFWYRQHQDLMYANAFLEFPGPFPGSVSYDSPANTEPGMARMALDLEGRLIEMEIRPRETGEAGTPDWTPLFAAARLDLARFTPAAPRSVPPMATDARAAWVGRHAADGAEIRVEAAAWAGRPVFFSVTMPSPSAQLVPSWFAMLAIPVVVGSLVGGVLLAWRNVREGRVDRRGAAVVAWLTFGGFLAVYLRHAAHVMAPWELHILFAAICQSGLIAASVYVIYLALEPYARRHWPDSLISWKRLQSGYMRDTLVASHVLAGVVAMLAWQKFGLPLLAMTISAPAEWPELTVLSDGASPAMALLVFAMSIGDTLNLLIAVILLRLLIRRIWIADALAAVAYGLTVAPALIGVNAVFLVDRAHGILATALVLWLMRRFGLLASAAAWSVYYLAHVHYIPGSWFAGRALATLAIPAVVAAWALWVILADKRQASSIPAV